MLKIVSSLSNDGKSCFFKARRDVGHLADEIMFVKIAEKDGCFEFFISINNEETILRHVKTINKG